MALGFVIAAAGVLTAFVIQFGPTLSSPAFAAVAAAFSGVVIAAASTLLISLRLERRRDVELDDDLTSAVLRTWAILESRLRRAAIYLLGDSEASREPIARVIAQTSKGGCS